MTDKYDMKPMYYLIKTIEVSDDNKIIVYGIGIKYKGKITEYKSLSSNKKKVKELLSKIITNNLDVCHFKDVVDDFIYELNKVK